MKYKLHRNNKNLLEAGNVFSVYASFKDGDFIDVRNPNNKGLQLRAKTNALGVAQAVISSNFRMQVPLGISFQDGEGYVAKVFIDKDFAFEKGFSQIDGVSVTEIGKDSGELVINIMNISGTTTVIGDGILIGTVIIEKVDNISFGDEVKPVEKPTPVGKQKVEALKVKRKYNRRVS